MKTKRIEYISLASVLSAIAVVFLHANECVGEFSLARYWFTANFIHSVFIYAVPIFFMISGAMLLDFNKKYDLRTYFSKRIHKTLIPYIFWSIMGIFFQIFYLSTISQVDLAYICNCFVTGRAIVVYWFFIPLFELYILFPICSRFVQTKKHCLLFMIFLFLSNSVLFFFNIIILGHLFFAVFGFYVHKFGVSRKVKLIFYSLAIFGFLANLFGSYYLSITEGRLIRPYINLTLFSSMIYPLGVFIFIKYDLIKIMENEYVNRIVSFLDFYTFGIYLIHYYIIQIFIKLFNINIHSIIFRLGAPFIVIPISVILIYVLRKIPLMKNIVP